MEVTLDELQGASKTTGMLNLCCSQNLIKTFALGGIARGNAAGNTFTFGDEPTTDLPALHKKGKVIVYISNQDPALVLPKNSTASFQCTLQTHHMAKPVMEALAKKWPTVTHPGRLYYFNL